MTVAPNQALAATVWRDDMWLSSFPLNYHTALDYFSCSPFWDPDCNNNRARQEQKAMRELRGLEYTLDSCQEPHLFVICKQRREAADTAVAVMFYYILDGSIYQTPTIHMVLSARLSYLLEGQTLTKAHNKMPLSSKCLTSLLQVQSRCLYNVQSAFLRLQHDLDPLMKPVPAPSIVSSLPPVPSEQSKPLICRVPSNEDMHSTNRIISHVLRKNALSVDGKRQQSSMLSSEPSEFHLPQVRANTPAASGAAQS